MRNESNKEEEDYRYEERLIGIIEELAKKEK